MVSVIITTHNRRKMVENAINSVLNQTYPEIELIIVNDNSTDDTNHYLHSLSDLENVIIIQLNGSESKGGNHARNVGIKAANGEYVAFLDDDDEWLPTKLEKQVKKFQSNPCIGMVYCGFFYEYDQIESSRTPAFVSGKMEGDLSKECLTKVICFTSSMIVKKLILEEVGLFDENLQFWQETELNIRIANKTEIGYVNEPLFIYRVIKSDKDRLSNKYELWWEAIKYIEEKHKQLLEKQPAEIYKKWKRLIYNDAATRCRNQGNRKEERKNRWKAYMVSHKFSDFCKFVFLFNEYPQVLRKLKK